METTIYGTLLTVVNTDLGDADTSYTYIKLGQEDDKYIVIDFTIQNTTLTLEATNSGSAVADTSAVWTDITSAMTGAANATASGSWIIDTPLLYGKLRVKRLTTNATNALTLRVTKGR